MNKKLIINKVSSGEYAITYNTKQVATFLLMEDEYFHCKITTESVISSWILLELSQLLDEINKPRHDEITETCKSMTL